MNTREKILLCLEKYQGEAVLVGELNRLIEEEGAHACKQILHILTQLEMDEAEATRCWTEIIRHHGELNAVLKRTVSLRTAICDYFCSINQVLTNPKIVEIYIFEKTMKASMYDYLTGLLNRSAFDGELIREFSRAGRYGGEFSLLFLDLDDFKKVNDDFGHQAGDMVLQKVAETIQREKRIMDIAGRFGGEEFVVILPSTGKKDAMLVGERIRDCLDREETVFQGRPIPIPLSGGLASFPSDANNVRELIRQADLALCRAKTGGKNRISVFSPDKRHAVRLESIRDIKVMELGFTNSPTVRGQSKNLSIGGVLFENPYPFDPGTRVQLTIPIDQEEPLLAIGTVVRVELLENERFAIGVSLSLSEMDKSIKSRITRWIRNQEDGETCIQDEEKRTVR